MKKKDSVMKSTLAYERIRNLILRGDKLPGSHLVLADLEEELHIGRGPIRDALMRLDRNGMITMHPYKGAIVETPPSFEELGHIYALRMQIERTLALDAMQYMTDKHYAELEAILKKMEDLNPERFVPLDREFHYTIYRASKFNHLCLLASKIFDSVELFLQTYLPDKKNCEESLEEHRLLLNALKTKDAELLSQTLTRNIKQRGLDTLKAGYNKYGWISRGL